MISVVVYGRNDNHGYNLHKRAAVSLNAISEVLADPDDEIIFVDYNSADDLPTFPEAIADTLSAKTRKLLRVVRVRPDEHRPFAGRTGLEVLESISRNVAIRRANPANRWILSTNTDIVIVPRNAVTLNDVVRDLKPGFYQAPRLEIPETIWEGFDRADGPAILSTVRELSPALHLDEIVFGNPNVLYDGPGDFQLMERDAIFAIGGFHEDMLLGWHVDANLTVRMKLHHGAVSPLGDHVFAYHCDHTRQITRAHRHDRQENDGERFVNRVRAADIPDQAATWGLAGKTLEEFRLDDKSSKTFVDALKSAVGAPQTQPYVAAYASDTYDRVDYDPRHILPFLVDLLSQLPKGSKIGWFGIRQETRDRFVTAMTALGFPDPLLIDAEEVRSRFAKKPAGATPVDRETMLRTAAAFVFDFGSPDGRPNRKYDKAERFWIGGWLNDIVAAEGERQRDGALPRRIIGIDSIHNRFEQFFAARVAAAATPFSSRIRHGFALTPAAKTDWLGAVRPGPAGTRTPKGVESKGDVFDRVLDTSARALLPGLHRLTVGVSGRTEERGWLASKRPPLYSVEVRAGESPIALAFLYDEDIKAGSLSFEFPIKGELANDVWGAVALRIRNLAGEPVTFTRLETEQLSALEAAQPAGNFYPSRFRKGASPADTLPNWAPALHLGRFSERSPDGAILCQAGSEQGHMAFGPYWPLAPGKYSAEFALSGIPKTEKRGATVAVIEVVQGDRFLKQVDVNARELSDGKHDFFFTIDKNGEGPVEFRTWSAGIADLRLSGLAVKRV